MDSVSTEIRTVQAIRGSYILYLPKDWCDRNSIAKGSRVYVRSLGRRLMIEPVSAPERVIEVSIDDLSREVLKYMMISFYVLGYRALRLYSRREIGVRERRYVREILRLLRSFEIYEEGRNYILVREVAETRDLSTMMMKEFNSVAFLIRVLRDYIGSLVEGRSSIDEGQGQTLSIEDIEELDTEVDITRLEIKRIYSKILTDLSIDPGVDQRVLSSLVMIGNILERIGDHTVEALRILVEGEVGRGTLAALTHVIEDLEKSSTTVNNYLELILKSLFVDREGLYIDTSTVVKNLAEIIDLKRSFREKIRGVSGGVDELFVYHITRIFDYITDIAEYLIDISTEITLSIEKQEKKRREVSQG